MPTTLLWPLALPRLADKAAQMALIGRAVILSPMLFFSPGLQDASQNFLPYAMANSMTAVKPLAHTLPAGLIFGLLCVYALTALAAGALALTRRDA